MTKSHVSLEQYACIVCGDRYDTGSVLLHKRLSQVLDHYTVTGYGMCPKHQKLKDDGYVALIECDPSKTRIKHGDQSTVNAKDAYRTGNVGHVRNAVFERMFNVPLPDKGICFIEPEVFKLLSEIVSRSTTGENKNG